MCIMSISADIVLIFKLQDNITKLQLLQVLISLKRSNKIWYCRYNLWCIIIIPMLYNICEHI